MNAAISKINREIKALAIPNVLSNVSVPLISSVDTYLMGQLSPVALAAVGVGSMVFNFLYWNMGFLRMGTTGMTAQAFGRNDPTAFTAVLFKAGFVGVLISFLFIVLQVPLFDLANWAMDADNMHRSAVWSYFSIRIWAAPASLLLMVCLGWFFGMQNAKYPLYITLFINVINIVVSFYLVRHKGMEVAGAAWGTVIAQVAGLIFCLLLLFKKYGTYIKQSVLTIRSVVSNLSELLNINRDIFIRTLFLSTAFLLIFRFSEDAGPDMLAINVVFLQFLNWMSYAIDGFAYAAESLVGKYKGADDDRFVRLSIRWNMIWGLLFALLFAAVYYLFADELFTFFIESDDGSIRDQANEFFIWMVLLPIVGFACYIWDGIFVGLTASRAMRNSMFLAFLVYLLSYYLFPESWNNHRIWAAFFLFLISRSLFQYWFFRQRGWRNIR